MPLTRETPLTGLPGVGPARAKKLEKLGLHTLGEINSGDRPAPRREAVPQPPRPADRDARDEMARMEKYLQQLRDEQEGS